ncbi:MAG: hypothetical protein ACPLRW_07475 [Moorellales bacterium]
MGVKGKDLALWLFFPSAVPAVFLPRPAGSLFFVLALACGVWFWLHYLVYVPRARRAGRRLGLSRTVLLPVPLWWAKALLRLSGQRIDLSGVRRAFEVHVDGGRAAGIGEFCRELERDLDLAARAFPGQLFIWETAVPLPARFRTLVREEVRRRRAVWERGGWPVPGFAPWRGPRGAVRRGAVVAPGQDCR